MTFKLCFRNDILIVKVVNTVSYYIVILIDLYIHKQVTPSLLFEFLRNEFHNARRKERREGREGKRRKETRKRRGKRERGEKRREQ